MIKEKINLIIVKSLVILSFLSPVLISNYFFFPYIVPKTLFFQIIIELALFFYILLIISNKKYLPKIDLLAKSVLLFFGIYVLAAIFGENVFRSFFGVFERMLGVFNLAHFIVLFFITRAVFISKKDWVYLFRSFLFFAFFASLYAVGQKLNVSYLYNTGADRVDSTVGNAAFFAGYMIFNAFFALFMVFWDKKDILFTRAYKVLFVLFLFSIYITETRGAILAVLIALIFFFFSYIFFLKKEGNLKLLKSKKIIYPFLVFLALLFVVFVFNKNIILDPIKRISSISFEDTTTKTRILAAGVSWQGFLEKPILGWGPENYNLVFDKYYNPDLYPAEQWFDHAHNIIFDNLVSSGIFGLLSYLSMLFVSLYLLYKYGRRGKDEFILSRVLIALVLAYFIQNQFVFDSLVTYLSFFILLAFISFLYFEGKEKIGEFKSLSVNSFSFSVLAVLFIFSIYFFNLRPAIASHYVVDALLTPVNKPDVALKYFDKSFDFAFFGRPEISNKMIDYTIKVYEFEFLSKDEKDKFLKESLKRAREATRDEPKNFRYYSYFVNLAFLDLSNKELLLEADSLLDKASDFAPNKPGLYYQKYQIKALLEENNEALENLKKGLDLSYSKDIALLLADGYRKTGMVKDSIDLYIEIDKKSELSLKEGVKVAIELASMGDNENAINIIRKIIKNNPNFENDSKLLIDEIKRGVFLGGNFNIDIED